MSTKYLKLTHTRAFRFFLVFALLYAVVAVQAVRLTTIERDKFVGWAEDMRKREREIRSPRGNIYDRNGAILAADLSTVSIYASPRMISSKVTARIISESLGVPEADIAAKLLKRSGRVCLAKDVDPRVWDKMRSLSLAQYKELAQREKDRAAREGRSAKRIPPVFEGVWCEDGVRRCYPFGALASQVVGFTDFENKGVYGVEAAQNAEMAGTNGRYAAEVDVSGREIPGTRHVTVKPAEGRHVYLTIDANIQSIAERSLTSMARKYTPSDACVIVMDPHTGEILALANYPAYDANQASEVSNKLWRNRAVSDLYEPGSTMKAVTVAAGLNEGFSPTATIVHCSACEQIKGGRLVCPRHGKFMDGHGRVDMHAIMRDSCNIGAAHVAMRLGAKRMRHYAKEFGLLTRSDSGIPGESIYPLPPADKWGRLELANIGYGQAIAVTPMHMVSVFATIAAGGVRHKPQIVREVRDHKGRVVKTFAAGPGTRVISPQAARAITEMMTECVIEGTGKPAAVDGRSVAGKTGSAQIALSNGRGFEQGKLIVSFIGFAPASDPKLAIGVIVRRPNGAKWGSVVAAPVFKEIAEQSLWYLKVPPDMPQSLVHAASAE